MQLQGGKILNKEFKLEKKDLFIKNGKISFKPFVCDTLDITGLTVIPGLIDLHIHGYCGTNIVCANEYELDQMNKELIKQGITSSLATIDSRSHDKTLDIINALKNYMESRGNTSGIIGIYMEGPYLNHQFKGGMVSEVIRKYKQEELAEYLIASDGKIKIVTLAPELDTDFEMTKVLIDNGVLAAIGHTNATADEVDESIKAGISHVTHLFNAMRGIHHREPGVPGAVFDSDITAELICDGYHVNEKIVRIAYKLLGRERLILVSDANCFSGLPEGEYDLDGRILTVRNGTCKLKDGTLASSMNSLFQNMCCAIKFGIPFEDAVYCSSYMPAKRIGIDDQKGSIDEGKDADLVIIDDNLNIRYVIKNGEIIKVNNSN